MHSGGDSDGSNRDHRGRPNRPPSLSGLCGRPVGLLRQPRIALLGVALALCLFAGGCAQLAEDLRTKQWESLLVQKDWVASLRLMRAWIAHPTLHTKTDLAKIRMFALRSLGDYVRMYDADLRLDEEATRYYSEGIRYAQGDAEMQAALHHNFASYYAHSKRHGLALPYLRKELEHWERVQRTFQIILGYAGLGITYRGMGELHLAEHYMRKALELARQYFVPGGRPLPQHEWDAYVRLLEERMDQVAREGPAGVEEVWALLEPILPRFSEVKAVFYGKAADLFGVAGDLNRAGSLTEKAKEVWAKEGVGAAPGTRRVMEAEFGCLDASLALRSRRFDVAARGFDQCQTAFTSFGIGNIPIALHELTGAAHEGANDLDKAIKAYQGAVDGLERFRASFALAERATFFEGPAQRLYWGLVRSLTRRALVTNRESDLAGALHASELLRARQLRERLGVQTSVSLTPWSLEGVRRQLSTDEVVLAYTLTEREIVLLAVTRDDAIGALTPYDAKQFRSEVRALARDLASPASEVGDLNARLITLSRVLLDPVSRLLPSKASVVFVPDGILNAIPLELLTAEREEYRPLIADYVVRIAPALQFVTATAGLATPPWGAALFALADPTYPKEPIIAGLSRQELLEVVRDINITGYFQPLPETRTEVQSIAQLFRGEEVEVVIGDKATESRLKKEDLWRFRFIHLATHGILGGEVPGIGEPALVLGEESNEDGFLTASEAAKLKLTAELTVLSACKTGAGEYYTGEGVMGLGRAFLLAGSRSVVVSLWSVESKATERLMVIFYRHLRGGMDPPGALRRAKLDFMGEAQTRGRREVHPFFWAAFVVFGG